MATAEKLIELMNARLTSHEESVSGAFYKLSEKVDNINQTLTTHVAKEDAERGLVSDLKSTVFGNGKPGHSIRLDRLEQFRGRVQWALGILSGATVTILTYAIYILIGNWLGKK